MSAILFLGCLFVPFVALAIFLNRRRIAKEMKAGKAVIIPPKYGLWGTVGFYAFWVGVIIILFVLQTQFLDYLSSLEKGCKMYMGLNPTYFRELVSLIVCIIVLIVLISYSVYEYIKVKSAKGQFYPSLDIQPNFTRNVCKMVDEQYLRDAKGNIAINFLCAIVLCMFSYLSVELPLFPFSQANDAYQQACLRGR